MAFSRFTAPFLLLSFSIISLVLSSALPTISNLIYPLPIQTVYEFPPNNSAENIAVRQNGQLLVTLSEPAPQLYQIDPFGSRNPILIYQFPNVTSALGITETTPDIFYVVSGSVDPVTLSGEGTFSVWKFDLTAFSPSRPSTAVITKTADFPDALLLNGMITLDASAGLLLISDSGLGLVWRLNVHTGQIIRAIQDPLMAHASPPNFAPLGINGIKIRDGSLFFTNSDRAIFARAPIHPDGTASGAGVVVATNVSLADDFQFDFFGDAFVAQNSPANMLGVVKHGQAVVTEIASIEGTTACQFGRTAADSTTLYITFDGNFTMGGGVVKAQVGIPGPANVS